MSKVNVFITVDTEHSIGGAFRDHDLKPVGNDRRIFYRVRGKDYGIGLIADIAERYGLRVCFFTEVLNRYYFGEEESRSLCRYIIGRGHDLQLHLHPNYLSFTLPDPAKQQFSDMMYDYSLEKQTQLIAEGRELLLKYGAKNLIAFRAGNFAADRNTLTALEKNGFLIDTSYNLAYLGGDCQLNDLNLCDAERIGNIWEFPVTNFLERNFGRWFRYRMSDINGMSFLQIRKVLDEAAQKGPGNITILMHSFSFINPADVQYRSIRPRSVVIRRFENLCRYLAENNDRFQVMTFGDMSRKKLADMEGKSVHCIPETGFVLSLLRKAEQAWDMLPKRNSLTCDYRKV